MNRKNEILAFRSLLAEKGLEMTPRQAREAYKASKSIVNTSRKMSMLDIWNLEEVEGMSSEERKSLVEIYKSAKEL
jgi:hypothetical protein